MGSSFRMVVRGPLGVADKNSMSEPWGSPDASLGTLSAITGREIRLMGEMREEHGDWLAGVVGGGCGWASDEPGLVAG
jgi:hypothetical protein